MGHGEQSTERRDESLVREAQAGDRDALCTLLRKWDRSVLNIAYRLSGNVHDAEDLRQRAYLKCFQTLARFRGEAQFSTWLYRIVFNAYQDGRRRRHLLLDGRQAPRAPAWDSSSDGRMSTAVDIQRERVEDARSLVLALPLRLRIPLILRHYEGMTYSRIAEILACPETTVKSQVVQALGILRERLKSVEDRSCPVKDADP